MNETTVAFQQSVPRRKEESAFYIEAQWQTWGVSGSFKVAPEAVVEKTAKKKAAPKKKPAAKKAVTNKKPAAQTLKKSAAK